MNRDRVDPERLRAGDSAYFEALTHDYGRLVESIIASFDVAPDQADDLYQEVWKRVYEARERFDGRSAFSTWLHRITTRICINFNRRSSTRAQAFRKLWSRRQAPTRTAERLEAKLDQERRDAKLHAAVRELSPRESEAITLRVIEGRSPGEVAREMRCTKATVRSLIRHGVKRLRKKFLGE